MTASERSLLHYSQHVSLATVRRVWAAASRAPCASIYALATDLGLGFGAVAVALQMLHDAGYVLTHGKRARTVIIPFIIVERKR